MQTMLRWPMLLVAGMSVHPVWPQPAPRTVVPQQAIYRRYTLGENLRYRMKGSNQGWEYQITVNGTVKQDDKGMFYESIGWSDLESNAPMTLSPAMLVFRQTLSLAPENTYLTVPDLTKVQPFTIGPITDLLTFYSDLFLGATLKLNAENPHIYFEHGTPNSWADGTRVIVGQDSIDFDLSLVRSDAREHTALLQVRHVPPKHPQVVLPAEWMKVPVSDTLNNFIHVEHVGDKYTAEVGQEKFEVQITVDTRDGKILKAQLHNPVRTVVRECEDADLMKCGVSKPNIIVRDVTLEFLP